MTDGTDDYRAKAEHCRRMADRVSTSPLDKEMWLQLAADWSMLASVRERYRTGRYRAPQLAGPLPGHGALSDSTL
jgi:hypothetical protein